MIPVHEHGARYFVTWWKGAPETEVSREDYMDAERSAGFRPLVQRPRVFGLPDSIARASFDNGRVSGRVEYAAPPVPASPFTGAMGDEQEART